ncbi:MAG TPA: TlpA disulfide reductase family protein [Puia sp.]|nr:TlpA disulfide reductase family protein [Puia sp.]
MKKIILSLLVLSPAGLWAQQNRFTIDGQLRSCSVNGQTIYLVYATDGKTQLDSAQVTAGKYAFKGELTHSGPATLFSVDPRMMTSRNPKNHVGIFLEPVSFGITHVDSFSNVQINGSPANTEYSKLEKQLDPLIAKGQTLAMEYQKASSEGDEAKAGELKQELETLGHTMKEGVLATYVKNNPSSPIALFTLESCVSGDMDPDIIGPLFDHLSEASKTSAEGQDFQKTIAAARKTSIGQVAPDFTQNDTLGKPVSLSSFRGNYVLVDFWASWCGPCRMENPKVVAAFNRYKGKGFRILSVSLDQPGAKDKWLEAIHKDGLSWTHVSDLNFWDNAVAKVYGVKGIPQNFLLDPQGKIVAKGLRGEELEKKLGELYK